jgi:hypothetical protein
MPGVGRALEVSDGDRNEDGRRGPPQSVEAADG